MPHARGTSHAPAIKHPILGLVTGVLCVLLAACGAAPTSRHIADNPLFTLSGDTLTEGGIVVTAATPHHIESTLTRDRLDSIALAYCHSQGHDRPAGSAFVGGQPWRDTEAHPGLPQCTTGGRLLDAVWNMSLDHVSLSARHSTYDAGGDTASLYCAMALALAWLEPSRTQRTLRALAPDGMVKPLGQWPMDASRIAWAEAAWNAYAATGDKQWLAEAHDVIERTLTADEQLLADATTSLAHGASWPATGCYYPTWMQPCDVAASMPLLASVLTCRARALLELADEELGLEHNHAAGAQHLKDAINQHLWNEQAGHYSAYLYGPVVAVQAPAADNLAQALAVLGNVADDDRAATLLTKTPIGHKGVNLTSPDTSAVEPYFTHPVWPAVQALWTLAAARQDNEEAMCRGLAALIRAQALFQSRHITVAGCPTNDLVTAASSLAVTLRALAGLHYLPDGIELHPTLPDALPGGLTITGLRYRQATLDISITGTGNDVATLTIDGNPTEGKFIPATLTGRHTVHATLRHGHTTSGMTIANARHALPPTPDVVWTPDSGCIVNYVAGGSYRLMTDGHLTGTVSDMAFALPPAGNGMSQLAVAMAGRHGYGFTSRPTVVCGSDSYTITLAPLPADSLAATITAARSGTHLLQIDYRSTAPTCDALLVSANTHPQGTVLLPPAQPDSTAQSPMLPVKLLRGSNQILLTRPPQVPPSATPITLRIIKK
ncbi:MAG: hypothetical protein IJT30_01805 [Muribaculaceae bacterium]|nr:hypothetical protein [Muribaculaceae bacterium]